MRFRSDYQKLNGVIARSSSLEELRGFDGLILDIDGVLVDVRSSFRKAIAQTASYFCCRHISPTLARKISPSVIKKFKLTPGFNNDWELTYSLILCLISFHQLVVRRGQIADFNSFLVDFLKKVANQTGGLKGVKKVFEQQNRAEFRKYYSLIPYEEVKRYFQELYGGLDYCEFLYGFKPKLVRKKGLVNKEKILISKEHLKKFYPNLALITGRTEKETRLFLKNSSFQSLFKGEAVVHNGLLTNKPHPAPLNYLMETLGFQKAVYIGDVFDDWLMVQRYCKIYQERKVFGGIVVNSFREANTFLKQGVDFVANSTESALNFLLKEGSR